MFTTLAFYLFSAILLGSAAAVVSSRNPVHSVLFLILAFFNAAALFLIAGAEFLAMILLIVYVGAVAVLFLFVVMMLDVDFAELKGELARYLPLALVIAVVLLAQLGIAFSGWTPAETAAELGLPFEAVDLDRLGAEADVIVSITSSFSPLLMNEHVRGETHIAAMGTDTKGKQELDPALVARAKIYTDEVAQAVSIGECQHAVAQGLVEAAAITRLGAAVNGTDPGRDGSEITLFDGTGVGLQDLAVAAKVVQLAQAKGIALDYDERWAAITGLLEKAVGGKASMLQDVQASRQTEIEVINGAIVAAGAEVGVAVPVNQAMVWMVEALQSKYLAATA